MLYNRDFALKEMKCWSYLCKNLSFIAKMSNDLSIISEQLFQRFQQPHFFPKNTVQLNVQR